MVGSQKFPSGSKLRLDHTGKPNRCQDDFWKSFFATRRTFAVASDTRIWFTLLVFFELCFSKENSVTSLEIRIKCGIFRSSDEAYP